MWILQLKFGVYKRIEKKHNSLFASVPNSLSSKS